MVYCQCAVGLTRAAAISVIYRMVGGGDFFRPVTVMWRFCTNNKVSQGAAGDFLTFLLFYFEFFTLKTSISKYILKSKIPKFSPPATIPNSQKSRKTGAKNNTRTQYEKSNLVDLN